MLKSKLLGPGEQMASLFSVGQEEHSQDQGMAQQSALCEAERAEVGCRFPIKQGTLSLLGKHLHWPSGESGIEQ